MRNFVPVLDLGWLLLESKDTPNHVGALMIFDLPAKAGSDYLRDLTAYLRSGENLVSPWNLRLSDGALARVWPMLESCSKADMEYHVRRHGLPRPGGERELGELVSRLHSTPLDLRRPMWECHLIEGLDRKQFALFLKIHHALVDGVAGMRIIQSTLSSKADERRAPPWCYVGAAGKRHKTKIATRTSSPASRESRRGLVFKSIANLYPAFFPRVRRSESLVTAFAAPRSILNGRITVQRRLSTQRFPLSRFRRIAEKAGVSVNDAVLAMCGGGLRRLLAEAGELPERKSLIACIPVSVRQENEMTVGTAISFGLADLATNEADPLRRIERVHASTKALKNQIGALPRTTVGAFTLAVMGPFLIQHASGLAGRMRPMFNLVVSNVPGPQQDLFLFGARLDAMYPASVLYHGQALNITCLRYLDDLNFGFTAWRDALPHVHRIAVYCGEALLDLERELGLVPK
ncbi:acyltransferase, WS/DGAT/MGAT [Fontimonas thermophila]|uniref:diacylglycerol O-acyltransferase n=1 Tax=Fontimonas thermophila TaxID=1076937 RepID=A0A1I2KJJ7_9GAMM|nr:wax ester/triacylglycerol synthase family O-acyltransferase [Fontimonas thermophila]SFF66479.1 acyltransferase, WS/DGAT/MGAT [Fontimonas thermophila]